MTDLEMTKLCAEAMGFYITKPCPSEHAWLTTETLGNSYYNPLHDDAQAMALVKKFQALGMRITGSPASWHVAMNVGETIVSHDLNRAICQCVARINAGRDND